MPKTRTAPGKAGPATPSLPGEQQEARERRARRWRIAATAGLAVLGWALLIAIVGPTASTLEAPGLGPASRDMVALRDFIDAEPVPDLARKQEVAAAAVPIQYIFDGDAPARRIDVLRAAFRLVRPRYRMYISQRERLLKDLEQQRSDAEKPGEKLSRLPKPPRRGEPDRPAEDEKPADPAVAVGAVEELDTAFAEEMNRLRPEFETLVAVRRTELSTETFKMLQKNGFSEEVELLLSDVLQVLLAKRIVRDRDRFEDDLARGVLDVSSGKTYDRATAKDPIVDVEGALKLAEQYVQAFVKQKQPSRFDDAVLAAAVRAVARSMIGPTFTRDIDATHLAEQEARASVAATRLVGYSRGQSLVKRGDMVTPAVQRRVRHMLEGLDTGSAVRAYLATALLLAAILALFAAFGWRHLHHFHHRPRDAALLGSILLVHAVTHRLLFELGYLVVEPGGTFTATMWVVMMPYALGPTMATLFLRPFTAAPFVLVCAVVSGLMAQNAGLLRNQGHPSLDVLGTIEAVILGIAGVYATRRFRQRSDLVLSAMWVAGLGVTVAAAVALFTAPMASNLWSWNNAFVLVMGVVSAALSYLLTAALTPIFESTFNRLTDIKLLELTSMNHPALRLLAQEVPGTFTHSVMVGNLAEAACEAIGANGLLARVGSYYHDVGKSKAARYFAENQTGDNPHDRIKPHLSALIIKNHVKDGIKMLREFGLPGEIIDFVPEHHGTGLIAHFYHRALRDAEETGEEVQASDFCYPGPKPRRRETALVMIADSVEAAARAMPEPNLSRISSLVQRIIAKKMEDGQFDECDLTLRELGQAEKAFVKILMGMHHSRPVYLPAPRAPHQTTAQINSQRTTRLVRGPDGETGEMGETGETSAAADMSREAASSAPLGSDTVENPRVPTGELAAPRSRRDTVDEVAGGETLKMAAAELEPADGRGPPESPTAVVSARRPPTSLTKKAD